MYLNIGGQIEMAVKKEIDKVKGKLPIRGVQAANAMTNSVKEVLTGQRSGKTYKVPGTGEIYTASAPGEPPAVRTGAFRGSFYGECQVEQSGSGMTVHSQTRSDLQVNGYILGSLLEDGTSKMASRPYQEKTIEKAMDEVIRIFSQPY